MTNFQLTKFIRFLQSQAYLIIGPKKVGERFLFQKIENPGDLLTTGELPFYPPKKYFFPDKEVLFTYKKNKLTENLPAATKQALFGLTPPDLKGVLLFHQVFEKDIYFNSRLKNTLIIGQSPLPCDSKNFCFWQDDFEEDTLEHLKFDIFLGKQKTGFKVYTGSEEGQKILDDFGFKNYSPVDYVGPEKEQGPDKHMLEIKKALKKFEPRFWEKLGRICLGCGRCSLVCPMCFCFDILDEPDLASGQGRRLRCWTTCFYDEFSQVAGSHRFLDSVAKRLYFWYEHKFIRLPEEFGISGCSGCGRCLTVCPVGINIQKNLKEILEE